MLQQRWLLLASASSMDSEQAFVVDTSSVAVVDIPALVASLVIPSSIVVGDILALVVASFAVVGNLLASFVVVVGIPTWVAFAALVVASSAIVGNLLASFAIVVGILAWATLAALVVASSATMGSHLALVAASFIVRQQRQQLLLQQLLVWQLAWCSQCIRSGD